MDFKWWNLPVAQIDALVPLLSDPDVGHVKAELRRLSGQRGGAQPDPAAPDPAAPERAR
ncbi:MAG: hypothetical protein LBD97_04995 [Bifidobacteriaceae bacterium]|nr:hypothetical protein [Bifidobacteriaceae bacterium]